MGALENVLKGLQSKTIDHLILEAPGIIFNVFAFKFLFYHTERVVLHSTQVGKRLGLDVKILQLSAWLHDIGYVENPGRHREVGAKAVKDRLDQLGLQEEEIFPIVDGILNHGTKDSPETKAGHVIRFADALSAWDPQLLSFYIPVTPCEEIKSYEEVLKKKEPVIEEYSERWRMRDYVERLTEKTLKLVDKCR